MLLIESQPVCTPPSLDESLAALAARLAEHPLTRPQARHLEALRARLGAGRFHLAVLGQFKRGKSTVLNALLGEPFLPMGVLPLTTIPTLVTYGPGREVRVFFENGRVEPVPPATLDRYVSEAGNPGNVKGVARVEARHPAALLERGVVLIDTPGIGSTLTHNTEATLTFLAEVDAALFLVSADPPITAAELDFLAVVRQRVPRLFFLLNKVDYLTPDEREQTVRFLEATLRERARLDGDLVIFPVSARQALEARQRGDPTAWVASGMAAVEARLLRFLDGEKHAALRAAIAVKAGEVAGEALRLIETERRALTMPLGELQEKHQLFRQALAAAQKERRQAVDLLAGDRTRAIDLLNARADTLNREAQAYLRQVLAEALAVNDPAEAERLARESLARAVVAFFDTQREAFSGAVAGEVAALLAPHAERANGLIEQLRRHAANLFALDVTPLSPDEPLARPRAPYWVRSGQMGGLSLPVTPTVWERLLPPARRRQRVAARLEALVRELAAHNTENLRWAVQQNTEQTFRQFQARLDERWAETIEATAEAIETALARRQARAAEVAPALETLDRLVALLQRASEALSAHREGR